MPHIETSIWMALKARIDTLVTSPAMIVIEPDSAFTPPKDASNVPTPYILCSDIRNDNVRVDIKGQTHIRSGTLMLSVNWPVSRAVSHSQLMQASAGIAAHFPTDTRMKYDDACLRVTIAPDVMQPYRDNDVKVCVVRIPWSTT